jgi:two-component system, OmpR family, sensor histidine kinase KdpD
MNQSRITRGLGAPYALPLSFAALLTIGAMAAGLDGRLPAFWVLVLAAIIVIVMSIVAAPALAPVIGAIGWFTVVGFSGRPYAQLRMSGPLPGRTAEVMVGCVCLGALVGWMMRRLTSSFTLWIVDIAGDRPPVPGSPLPGPSAPGRLTPVQRRPGRKLAGMLSGLDRRRQAAGVLLAAAVLPLLTWGLVADTRHLSLDDDLLIYLVAVVAIAVFGGFWPAVLAAVAASLLVNWYFTPPLHTFSIEEPRNLLALLLFVTVAVTVSSVVHLAARRASQAARSGAEAASLLALAQTVLSGADTPAAVLDHLTITLGGRAELLEQVRNQWIRVAVSGSPADETHQADGTHGRHGGRRTQETDGAREVRIRADLMLVVAGQTGPTTARLLDGFGAQAAAGLDRERLRTQAAQAEALAEGNRMRTALLAAVSHDLRTPLASIKASVSTLRQADVDWTLEDEAALLATIEESADRLDALIGNLLDMSRLTTGSLQPFLRPAGVDEVVPIALGGLDAGAGVQIVVPDDLPLVRTDPGLLERVLANLFSNALAHSPADRAPMMRARQVAGSVVLEVIDHGRGVPDDLKPRIFEPFERLGDRSGAGVGLGLAVAKGFAEAMGACLEAVDTPGGGLTMRITLPVATKSASSASSALVPEQ